MTYESSTAESTSEQITNLLPRSDLILRPNAWHVPEPGRLASDEGPLRDEETAGDLGALGVIFRDVWKHDVGCIGTESCRRGEDNAVLEFDVADADGLEKRRRRGRGHVEQCVVVE